MPHLYPIRKGWQDEHLGKFILSKFSFIAEPSTISDDLGSDFFCTLFNIRDEKFLLPRNSFAIQIKGKNYVGSRGNKFEIDNKRQYLNGLEIPFFVGIVDREELKLTIYSGEYITNYFSLLPDYSDMKKLFIHLVEERDDPVTMWKIDKNRIYLKFPKVVEIKADYNYLSDPNRIRDLFILCSLIQENISSKINNEYIFKRFNSPWLDIVAGSGSAQHYEENFLKRLTEVFYNLLWLYNNNNHSKEEIKKGFNIYKKLYLDLLDKNKGDLPAILISRFNELDALFKT